MKNIDLPVDFDTGKIVQLYIDGQPRLIGDNSAKDKYHSDLLEEILRKEGIRNFPTIQLDSIPVSVPALTDGERYIVVGMGVCQKFKNVYSFDGLSMDYGIGIDTKHLEDLQTLNPEARFIS